MTDLSAIVALIPEPWRGYALAGLYAFLATQIVASSIVALLPAQAFARFRVLRVLSWYAHLAPRDAAGTFKLPLSTPLQPGAMEELERLRAFAERVQRVAPELGGAITPPVPSKAEPVDHSGERGSAEVRGVALLLAVSLVLAGLGAVLSGCPRLPPVSNCTPLAYRCTDDGRPQVCSSTQRWEPIGDEACSAGGSVCVVDRTAHCAPHTITLDGGSDVR